MFIWVTQGLVEPYTPKVKPDSIKKVNPLHAGIADKPVEISDHEDTVEINHFKGGRYAGGGSFSNSYSQGRPKEKRRIVRYAKDIMSIKLFTISPNDPISDVEKLFNTHKFRHIPVVDSTNQIQGIVSERDLLRFTITMLRNSKINVSPDKVKDVMHTKVLSAFPETTIRDIARIMFEEKVGSVPIVNKESNKLVGMITRSDILRRVMNNPPLDIYT